MVDRRVFLKKVLNRLLVAFGLAFLAYPILSFMTFRKIKSKEVVFHAIELASPVIYKDGVYLIVHSGEGRALSAQCTHLGCTVRYDRFSKQFRCPCHGSVFAISGERLEGPAGSGLQPVPLKREENGDVVVTLTV